MNTKGGDILCNVNHAEHNIQITLEPAELRCTGSNAKPASIQRTAKSL